MRLLKRVLLLVLAIVGALVCLLYAVISGAIPVYCTDITDSTIEQVFANMQVAMRAGDYAAAFRSMSPAYRQAHLPNDLRRWMDSRWFQLQPHYYLKISGERAQVHPRECKFADSLSGPIFDLIKIDSTWYFTGEYDWPLD